MMSNDKKQNNNYSNFLFVHKSVKRVPVGQISKQVRLGSRVIKGLWREVFAKK